MTALQTGRIFISYRRVDSAGYAGRIYDRLATHFGKDALFMDVDTIEAGLDFVDVLENAVRSCDVLIALIGRQWLNIKDEDGKRRLDNPQDFVRVEIAAALSRSIRVIPVLVDGTLMPNTDQLPGNLKFLARRNAVLVNHHSFHNDANRLIDQLDLALKAAEESKILKAEELKENETQEKLQAEIENLLSQADIALELRGWEIAKEKIEAVLILDPEFVKAKVRLDIIESKLREIKDNNFAEEKTAKEKAEQEVAKKAVREKIEKEATEKVAREKAEQEVVDKATRENANHEATVESVIEKAEQEAAAEKAVREEAEHETNDKIAKGKKEATASEFSEDKNSDDKSERPPKPNSFPEGIKSSRPTSLPEAIKSRGKPKDLPK